MSFAICKDNGTAGNGNDSMCGAALERDSSLDEAALAYRIGSFLLTKNKSNTLFYVTGK